VSDDTASAKNQPIKGGRNTAHAPELTELGRRQEQRRPKKGRRSEPLEKVRKNWWGETRKFRGIDLNENKRNAGKKTLRRQVFLRRSAIKSWGGSRKLCPASKGEGVRVEGEKEGPRSREVVRKTASLGGG